MGWRRNTGILFASALLALLLGSAAVASERIPGPPLEPKHTGPSALFCPINGCEAPSRERLGDAVGFGLAVLGAAVLLRRSSVPHDSTTSSLDER